MKIFKKIYSHYVNDNISIQPTINNIAIYNLHIVYYINCLINKNYFDWAYNQIKIVYNYEASIYIIATISIEDEEEFRKNLYQIYPKVIIECNYSNNYEYPGILKVWQLGQIYNNNNDIILYLHSKGMTHHNEYKYNINDNYNIIFKDINLIKEIYTIFPTIDKIGYFSGGIGWIWYNFWYARGSYIHKLEKPLKTERRHYYEDWLSRIVEDNDKYCEYERPIEYYKNTIHSCYSLFTDYKNHGNIGSYYCPNTNKMIKL